MAVAALGLPLEAMAQSAAQRDQWARDCAHLGGQLNYNTGTCEGANSGGGAGGYTADQQAMLNLAGQFGSMLGAAIRQSFEQAARQAEINRIQREWEAEHARQRAAAAAEEQRRRNQALLANMRGAVGASELTMRGSGSGEGLRMRTTEEMFDAPNAPTSQPSGSRTTNAGQQAWDPYLAALQPRDEAERAHAEAASNLAAANEIIRQAELEIQRQESIMDNVAEDSDEYIAAALRAAELDRGLPEARRLRDRAEQRLAAARAAAEEAGHRLALANDQRLGIDLSAPPERQLVYDPVNNRVHYVEGSARDAQQLSLPRLPEVENSPGHDAWLRGMNATANHDWAAAETAFREAHARDPDNDTLERAVILAEWQRTHAPRAPQAGARSNLVLPDESDLELLFDLPSARPGAGGAVQGPVDSDLRFLFDEANESVGDLHQTYIMEMMEREASGNVTAAARQAHAQDLAGQALARLGSGGGDHDTAVNEAIALLDAAAREAPEVPNYAETRDALRRMSAYGEARTTATSSRIEPARSGGPNN